MSGNVCVNPAEIKEGDLAEFLDGRASPVVTRHVEACPTCARRVEGIKILDAALAFQLHRFSCPESEQLAAYQHAELRGSEALLVALHLRECPHCAREMAALARNSRKDLGGRVRAALKTLEAALVTPLRTDNNAPQAVPGAVRSAADAAWDTPRVYRATGIDVIVNQRPSRTRTNQHDLTGLVHAGGQVPDSVDQASVELYRKEGLIALEQINPLGQFRFAGLDAANYDLCLVWPATEIWLRGLQVA